MDGTDRLTYRDIAVITANPTPTSHLAALDSPEHYGWTTNTYLLAHIIDALNGANWQRSGQSNQKRPKPFPRPTTPQDPAHIPTGDEAGTITPEATPINELRQWLAATTKPRPSTT